MIKKMLKRKIVIASTALLLVGLLYFIPTTKENNSITNINQTVEYVSSNNTSIIYLLDNNNYIARTKIAVNNNEDTINKAKNLIEALTIEGKKSDIIPNGFQPIIPSGTKILNISLDNATIKIDFTKEIFSINEQLEEKMVEAITYTLTSIDGIDGVIIYVEGELLTQLPHSKKYLPTFLDKNYGINKIYDITTTKNIDYITVFYVSKFNNNYYYVPVTKYLNTEENDKVKIIVEELSSTPLYESNLMSYLETNTKLLDYEIKDQQARLNFTDNILFDGTDNSILEEVIYTISLTLDNLYDIDEVTFQVNGQEIYDCIIKDID